MLLHCACVDNRQSGRALPLLTAQTACPLFNSQTRIRHAAPRLREDMIAATLNPKRQQPLRSNQ
jgi:hypothetical protein